jgi:hypothetical protein
MDVYHKVLLNLYNVTGGKDSQSVDLKDLVKNQGFLGNYGDIFQMLSGQGWIAETPKANYVRITHWGVKEVKKATDEVAPFAAQNAKKDAAQLISEAKLFLIMLEEFASDTSVENLRQVEKKLTEINAAIGKLKSGIE